MDDPYYLSVVVTARNDNHGGNLLRRMQLFVNGLVAQCKRHALNVELVLVEWNPPPDRPRLAEALSWPTDSEPCHIRIIEVPREIHQRFKHADQLPLFQMIGKNVGIRRARGRFVLATNIDILFSNELIHFLAAGSLKKNRMYRLDRYDVQEDVPFDKPIEDQLDYCNHHIIRIAAREGTRSLVSGNYHTIYPKLTWYRWLREKLQDWGLLPATSHSRLHTNACGDFTLMDPKHWFKLRGYPEFEMYSFHLDSVLCHAAHHSGVKEHYLHHPMRIYHIEHASGSGWTPEGKKKLTNRLDRTGIPQLEHFQFKKWAIQMRRDGKPIIFNNENWGLADESLEEISVYGALSR